MFDVRVGCENDVLCKVQGAVFDDDVCVCMFVWVCMCLNSKLKNSENEKFDSFA